MTDDFLDTLKGTLLGIIACAIISFFLSSCKAHQSVVSERVVYDTVWSVRTVHDSIKGTRIEREITRIVPHIIRVGDTTIVYSDTIINKNIENNTYISKNEQKDQGKISNDSARIEEKKAGKAVAKQQPTQRWRMFWHGIIVGILITICFRNRKKIVGLIRRLVKRV